MAISRSAASSIFSGWILDRASMIVSPFFPAERGSALPQLLGEEGNDRVRESQHRLQNSYQVLRVPRC